MSFATYEEEQRIKRRKEEGWYFNENGILVPPKPKGKLEDLKAIVGKQRDEAEGFKDRIIEAEQRNRRQLPDYVPEEEPKEKDGTSPMGEDDTSRLETLETKQHRILSLEKKIRHEVIYQARHTRRMSFRILHRVKKVESLLDKLIELSEMKKDDKKETLVLMTPQEKRKNLEKRKQNIYGRIHRAGWTVSELKKRGITVKDIMNGKPLPDE